MTLQPLDQLYDKLRTAMKLVLEYQQNPTYHSADQVLRQAEGYARDVYTSERVRGTIVSHDGEGSFGSRIETNPIVSWRQCEWDSTHDACILKIHGRGHARRVPKVWIWASAAPAARVRQPFSWRPLTGEILATSSGIHDPASVIPPRGLPFFVDAHANGSTFVGAIGYAARSRS